MRTAASFSEAYGAPEMLLFLFSNYMGVPSQQHYAIGLKRISSDDQLTGHSLDAQDASIRRMADELNVELFKIIGGVQSAKAGRNLNRKDLKEILDLCRRNRRIKYLLVDRVSRLMREMMLLVHYIVELQMLGVEVVFCDESQRYLNSSDQLSKLMLMVEGFKTEQENKERAETVISRMKARYAAGYYLSHPHAGYQKSNEPGIHVPNSMFPLLQRAGQLVIYDGATGSQAVKWLNDNGYRTPAGRKIDLNHFVEFIVDQYYCGIINIQSDGWPKGVRGLHQPMFTQDEHGKLCDALLKRNPRIRRKHNPDFPLANMLRHYECRNEECPKVAGHHHNRGTRNGRPRPKQAVYDCRQCRKRLRRDTVHQRLDELLESLAIADPNRLEKKLTTVWKRFNDTHTQQSQQLRRRIADLEQLKSKTTAEYVQAGDPSLKSALGEQVTALAKEITGLESSLGDLADNSSELEDFISFAIEKAEQLRQTWWDLSYEDRVRGGTDFISCSYFYRRFCKTSHPQNIGHLHL